VGVGVDRSKFCVSKDRERARGAEVKRKKCNY